MKDLKARTIRGGFAKICSQAANLVLRVGSLMVLARLLDPDDFGLLAMVTALTGVLYLFRDFGLSTAAVQRHSVTNDQISTLFWLNLLLGTLLTCVALAGAPLVAEFYREPRLKMIMFVLATGFLINAAGIQHSALLKRQMRFTTLATIETLALVASVVVGIAMALDGLDYWSLVGMNLVSPLVYTLCVWLVSGWTPGPPRRKIGIRSMLQFGGIVTLNSVVVYVAYNLEKVLLGRYWGADALGIYGRAYQLINIPTENLNSAIGEVAFSALSRVQEDPQRLKNYFLKGYTLVVAFTLPITIGCALFASDLISVILGPKWSEAAPIFRLLAPTVLIFAMINPLWWLMVSLGLVVRSLRVGLVLAPLVIASYFIGLPYGPQGVALGYSIVMALWVIPHIAWCVHGTVVSLMDILRVVSKPLFSAVVAALAAAAALYFSPESLTSLERLLVGIPSIFVVYWCMLLYAMGQKSFYVDLVRGLLQRPPPQASGDANSP